MSSQKVLLKYSEFQLAGATTQLLADTNMNVKKNIYHEKSKLTRIFNYT